MGGSSWVIEFLPLLSFTCIIIGAIKIGNNFMATVVVLVTVSTAVVSTFSHGLSTKCYKWPDHASMSQENQNRCLACHVTAGARGSECCIVYTNICHTYYHILCCINPCVTTQLRPSVHCPLSQRNHNIYTHYSAIVGWQKCENCQRLAAWQHKRWPLTIHQERHHQ